MVIRLNESPCKDCEFRRVVGNKWECGLVRISFQLGKGAYKCYSKSVYSPKELVEDIVEFAKKEGIIKVKDVSRHFGLGYRKASLILRDLVNAGVLRVLYASPQQRAKARFVLNEDYQRHLDRAVRNVKNHYPFARSTLEYLKEGRKIKLSSVELKRLELIFSG